MTYNPAPSQFFPLLTNTKTIISISSLVPRSATIKRKEKEQLTPASISNPINFKPIPRRKQEACAVRDFVSDVPASALVALVLGPGNGRVFSRPGRNVLGWAGREIQDRVQHRDGGLGHGPVQSRPLGHGGQVGRGEDESGAEHFYFGLRWLLGAGWMIDMMMKVNGVEALCWCCSSELR